MKAVIDTYVLLVANGDHADVSEDCVSECVRRLQAMQTGGVAVIDDGFRIIGEYLNKNRPNAQKGAGNAYLKWLLQNQANTRRVEAVPITELAPDHFAEFPDATLEPQFDAPDRKFAAVSHAHPSKPPVWQAADSKWLNWWPALSVRGVQVDFLCPEDACRFYRKKFPDQPAPSCRRHERVLPFPADAPSHLAGKGRAARRQGAVGGRSCSPAVCRRGSRGKG